MFHQPRPSAWVTLGCEPGCSSYGFLLPGIVCPPWFKIRLSTLPSALRTNSISSSTSRGKYFVSEASVYRLLKAHDLITSPAYVVIKAANEFKDKTTAINQLWQTDFTYLKITGWGWYYLSTVLDDFSRYIVAWRLGPTMCASDVTATLDQRSRHQALIISMLRSGRGF